MKAKIKVVCTPEEFKAMGSDNIAKKMEWNKRFAIRDDENGERRIIERGTNQN